VSIDIGDKMSRELKSYGANILIEPAGQAALPAMFSEKSNPLSGQDFLDEAELPNIKDIFWRNNIVGFAPMLGGEVTVNGRDIGVSEPSLASRWISRMKRVPDRAAYGESVLAGERRVAAGADRRRTANPGGHALARNSGWKVGDTLTLSAGITRKPWW
jgi:putative ABC transport system permease protein